MKINSYYENEKLWGRQELSLVQCQIISFLNSYCSRIPENARIADLGCGDGVLLKELIDKYPNLNGYGVDFSQKALQHLPPRLHPCLADLTSLPFDNGFFDLCFCIDVLEHIIPSDLNSVVAEIHRVCSGPVLMVSPFLESDAVRTICPHCGCVFNPYYHLNRFSLKSWEQLVSGHLEGRSKCFVPLGVSKPYIPPGVGTLLVAGGGYVTHHHETICPQCKVNFSRPLPGSATELSTLLGPYAAKNRASFDWIYEEMGVLTLPKTDKDDYQQKDIFDGICVTSKKGLNLLENEMPGLIVKSVYEIDCEDPDTILPGADLFRSPAYIVDNGKLKKCDSNPGILWRLGDTEYNEAHSTLRLVFPPAPDRRNVTLELIFSPKVAGTLRAFLNALPPKTPVQIGYIEAFPSEAPNNMLIKLEPIDDFVTPFGLLVDLVWEPQLNSTCSTPDLILHKIIHQNQQKEIYSIQTTGVNHWPEDPNPRNSYHINLLSDTISSLRYGYKGRLFDLTGQLTPGMEGRTIIPIPLFGGLKEVEPGLNNNLLTDSCFFAHPIYVSICDSIIKATNEAKQLEKSLCETEKYIEQMKDEKINVKSICAKLAQDLITLEQDKTKVEEQYIVLFKEIAALKGKLKAADRVRADLEILELERNYMKNYVHLLKKRNIIQRIFNRN